MMPIQSHSCAFQ